MAVGAVSLLAALMVIALKVHSDRLPVYRGSTSSNAIIPSAVMLGKKK